MKKILCVLSLAFVAFAHAQSLEVDRKELEANSLSPIEFVNYVGPHSTVNTAEEIRGIGTALGRSIRGSEVAGSRSTYFVIHAVDPSVTAGFDADILFLGPGSGVDHIDNVRRIISAYLSAAYGYSDADASTLARFITVYNAVYRGKLEVFSKRYKPVVTKHLTAESAGISTRYDQWPGKTQLVIPLSDQRLAGTISTVDTSALTAKDVTERVKEDGKEGTAARKDMADLKEREGDQAQKRAETAQKESTEAKAEATAKKTEAEAARKEADQSRKEAEKARAEADKKPGDAAAAEKAKAAEDKAAQTERVAETKAEESRKAEEAVAQKERVAEQDQKLADQKQQESRTERKEIAADAQKEQDRSDAEARRAEAAALANAKPALALRVADSSFLGDLVIVNLSDGKVLKSSPLNTVRNRIIIDAGGGYMAVAGKKSGSGAVRLVLIDPVSLDIKTQGTDEIAESSMLVKSGNDYYAILDRGGKGLLGRFDSNLALKAQSSVEVLPYTAITPTPNGILVQDASGAMRLLRATDLSDLSSN